MNNISKIQEYQGNGNMIILIDNKNNPERDKLIYNHRTFHPLQE